MERISVRPVKAAGVRMRTWTVRVKKSASFSMTTKTGVESSCAAQEIMYKVSHSPLCLVIPSPFMPVCVWLKWGHVFITHARVRLPSLIAKAEF